MDSSTPLDQLAHETIQSFLALTPTILGQIETSIAVQDSKKLEASAHILTDALAYLHAESSMILAQKLEFAAGNKINENAAEIFELLKTEMEQLITRLIEIKLGF